jgi:hypothetical protein
MPDGIRPSGTDVFLHCLEPLGGKVVAKSASCGFTSLIRGFGQPYAKFRDARDAHRYG